MYEVRATLCACVLSGQPVAHVVTAHTRWLAPHGPPGGVQTPTGGHDTGTNWYENLPSKRDTGRERQSPLQTHSSFLLSSESWLMG